MGGVLRGSTSLVVLALTVLLFSAQHSWVQFLKRQRQKNSKDRRENEGQDLFDPPDSLFLLSLLFSHVWLILTVVAWVENTKSLTLMTRWRCGIPSWPR